MTSFRFSPEHLKAVFTRNEWQKGARLFNKELIKSAILEDNIIRGVVRSESYWSESYLTSLIYVDKTASIEALCNCYVGYGCKHGAALAHYYLNKMSTNGASKSSIEKWLGGFELPKPTKTAEKALLYFLKPNSFDANDFLKVEIKSSRKKKNGGWSKSLSAEYLSTNLMSVSFGSKQDSAIIGEMLSGNNYKEEIKTQAILEQLVNTGRCYWLANYDLDHPITLGDPIEASWQWVKIENDLQTLRLVLTNPSKDISIIKSQPISYFNSKNNSFGKINSDINSNFEVNLLGSPILEEAQIPWVMSKLQCSLGDIAEKIPEPTLKQPIKLSKPIPQIYLRTPFVTRLERGELKLTFNYQGNLINPSNTDAMITTDMQQRSIQIYRDLAFEEKCINSLKSMNFTQFSQYTPYYDQQETDYTMMMEGDPNWHRFLHFTLPELKQQGWQVTIDEDFYYQQLNTNNIFDAEIIEEEGSEHDFFSIGLTLDINGQKMPAFPILASAIEQLPKKLLLNEQGGNDTDPNATIFIDLDKGEFIALSYKSIKPLLKQFIELFMPNALQKDGTLKLSRFQGHQTLGLLDEQGVITKGADRLRKLSEKLKNFEQVEHVSVPKQLNAELREYQHQGLNWLQFLREYQLNGILADDMGLGKTIQTLAHLLVEKQQGRLVKPCLIIAPTSVVFNWESELTKFTPTLTVMVLNGSKRQQYFDKINDYDVVVTSYALIVKDSDIYQKLAFYYLILDEAQYIKNPKTKLYQAVLAVKAEHKLCVTGTPMENNLGEFWAQFNFLLPGFLGGLKQFNKLFRNPIEKHSDHERKILLNQRIKPFILRRTKDHIATELPQKTEIIQTLRIEGKQAQLYESVRLAMDERLKDIIAKKGLQRSQIEILDALLKLRQVCNHPQLLPFDSAKKIKQSAKLEFLMDSLPELISEGRKILIFSQFTSMLALIENELTKQNIDYVKLTGASKNRQKLVEQFQTTAVPIFLISLRAGGVGLNLTAADTVIHFDPWWNPAVENQATDRAHRIGQTKPVFVYKLIIENSIEEKIQQIQQTKAELAKSLLSEEVSEGKLTLTNDVLGALMAPLS